MTYPKIEYRTLLARDEFNRSNSQFPHVASVTQISYYFDSENSDIRADRMPLRVRILPNCAETTLKTPKEVGNLEYSYNLSVTDAKEIIRSGEFPDVDLLKFIEENGIKFSSLKNFGSSTTTYRETVTKIGLMALDNSQYTDIEDYELELEVENTEQSKEDFDNFLAEYAIGFKYAKSRVARFSIALKRI